MNVIFVPAEQGIDIDRAKDILVRYRNAVSTREPAWLKLPEQIKIDAHPRAFVFTSASEVGSAVVDRKSGAVLSFDTFSFSRSTLEPLHSPATVREGEQIARAAFVASKLPLRIGIPHTAVTVMSRDSKTGTDLPAEIEFWFPLYDGELRLPRREFRVSVSLAFGRIKSAGLNEGIDRLLQQSYLPKRPLGLSFRPDDIAGAKASVASAAFAKGRALGVGRREVEVLDSTETAEPGLWLAHSTVSPEIDSTATPKQLMAAARGIGTPVWIVKLRGDLKTSVKDNSVAYPLVTGYVDAATGRVLLLEYFDVRLGGFGGRVPLGKPRSAPALIGSASLTFGRKTKAVRLVPVASTRPFALAGKAVLEFDKRIAEVEYDAKAGLVRFRGKLARTLSP